MNILLSNHQDKVKISDELMALIRQGIVATLESEEIYEDVEVSLLLIDNKEIKHLNNEYRNVNESTDVLSFPMYDNLEEALDEDYLYLGDIVISGEQAVEQAKDYGHSVEREVGYLTVHSVLHLLGYDHIDEEEKKVMRKREEEILERMNLKR